MLKAGLKAKLVLPQILNDKAWSDEGRINMLELMKLLKVSQNTAYRVRRELLKHYYEQQDSRGSEWGSATAREGSSLDQQEEDGQQSA